MTTLRGLSLALALAALGACDFVDPGAIGPDSGPELASTSQALEWGGGELKVKLPYCDTSFIRPKLTLISKDSTSLTMQLDTVDPDCRKYVDYWRLRLQSDILPTPEENKLANGTGADYPFVFTHTRRLPDTEYCYSHIRIIDGWATGASGCFRTDELALSR